MDLTRYQVKDIQTLERIKSILYEKENVFFYHLRPETQLWEGNINKLFQHQGTLFTLKHMEYLHLEEWFVKLRLVLILKSILTEGVRKIEVFKKIMQDSKVN